MIVAILRIALLAVIAVLLAAGCGGDPEPAPAETIPETTVPPVEPPDPLDLSSPGLTACTIAVAPGGPEWEISLFWTGEPDAAGGFHRIHTVSIRKMDGSEGQTFVGLEADINNVMDLSGYLVAEDMDFDGYTDFRLMEFPTAGPNTYWLFWLYDPAASAFRRASEWEDLGLVSPEFIPEENMVRSFSRDGYGLYDTRWFSMTEGIPALIRRESTEWEGDTLFMVTEETVDGLLVETSRTISEEGS